MSLLERKHMDGLVQDCNNSNVLAMELTAVLH